MEHMTPKERLEAIMDRKPVDRPACVCPGGMMNMVTAELMEQAGVYLPDAHSDARKMADLAKAVYAYGCFENVGVPFCMTVEAETLGAAVAMGSNVVEPHVSQYVMDTSAELEKLAEPVITEGRSGTVLEAIRLLKAELTGVPVVGNLTGPVSTATSLVEPTVFYREIRKKKRDVHLLMEHVTNHLIVFGLAQIHAGADVIAISDPSGTGELLGPRYFEEFTVQYLNRLIAPLKQAGAKVIVHICGQMRAVYPQTEQIHSDVLSFDSMVPMSEARRELPDRVLMGNVSTYALEFGAPEKVRTLTAKCVENGSDIISPACGLGMKSPLRNVQAMLACLKERA